MAQVNLDNTKALNKIADALEKIGKIADGYRIAAEAPATAEPAGGVPVLLIVEVLISLIRIMWSYVKPQHVAKLRELRGKLEPYQPVRPSVCLDGEEVA